jgi:hypothetical protein
MSKTPNPPEQQAMSAGARGEGAVGRLIGFAPPPTGSRQW